MKVEGIISEIKEIFLSKLDLLDTHKQSNLIALFDQLLEAINNQNKFLHEIKNSNIRLENQMAYLEKEVQKSDIYKSLLETILKKAENPFTALLYLFYLKRMMKKIQDSEKKQGDKN